MKKGFISLTSILLIATLSFTISCVGPQGEVGPIGPKGDSGEKEDSGNTTVIQYNFGSQTHNGSEISYPLAGMTQSQIENSAYFVYVQLVVPSIWYQIPGKLSTNNTYHVAVNSKPFDVDGSIPRLYINRSNVGGGSDIFSKTKVIFILSNEIRNGRKSNLDSIEYDVIKKKFNLKD